MTVITLFLDVVSPYTFFAFQVLKRYKSQWDVNLVLKPAYLRSVVVESGNTPPMACANKCGWMRQQDLPLASKLFGVEIQFPSAFPFDTLPVLKVLKAMEDKYGQGEALEKAIDVFFAAIWQPSSSSSALEVIKPENVAKLATSLLPAGDAEEVLQAAASTDIEEKLKAEAADLVKSGAFGFPCIVVEKDDGEKRSFFGSDRFEQIAFWLGKEWKGPLAQGVQA
ncbi:hypothetical protein JCM11251_005655 [Rhodosporidiobolus azoricus]